jgi:hypothetical protein
MKEAQGLSRISRSGEQNDAPITKAHCEISKRRQAIHKHNQLNKRSFHKVVWYHHPSNDKDTLQAKHGVGQLQILQVKVLNLQEHTQ